MEYLYYVGEGAKEEELGPIGRVFLNGHPESSPDLRLYLEREFPLRDYFVHRDARRYMALPLFESHDQICVGVLEFFGCPFTFEAIVEKLAAANLRSVNISHHSCFKESGFPNKNIVEGQQVALDEINVMIELVRKSPQLQVASVWIPCSECAYADNKMSCLELASSSDVDLLELSDKRIHDFIKSRKFLQLHPWKGVIGRTLESENKLCFCQNFCDFSIIEQPLAHYAQVTWIAAFCLNPKRPNMFTEREHPDTKNLVHSFSDRLASVGMVEIGFKNMSNVRSVERNTSKRDKDWFEINNENFKGKMLGGSRNAPLPPTRGSITKRIFDELGDAIFAREDQLGEQTNRTCS